MTLPRIPVIIPAYRKPEQLHHCLACLERQTQPVDIFVRDNSEDNIYFTAAVNEGIRRYLATDCPALLLLNQDMYLEPDAIEQLWRFMAAHPQCGIAGPIEALKDHPERLAKGGGLESFPWGRHRVAPVDAFRHDERLHWINGVCLLLRREMIEEIGLLDRNFKFICSDVDYCLTARERGWQVWRVGAALGEHESDGASTGCGTNPELEQIKVKDVLFFAKKWLTGDLYRKLAYGGAVLTPEVIAATMRRLCGEPEPEPVSSDPTIASSRYGHSHSPLPLSYYHSPRPEVLALVSPQARLILDIGCGTGALGSGLKARQPCHVSGMECVPAVARLAAEALDAVHVGDVMEILPTLPEAHFDTIIMADALEHLADTDQALQCVRRALNKDGELILSVPNVGHWSALRDLLEGRWEYRDHGILDRTHLRFFTRNSAMAALARHGFDVVHIEATAVDLQPPAGLAAALREFGVNAPTFEQDSRCFQYLFKARKARSSIDLAPVYQ
ncbi:MAG TPA: methyltransferase domain-containing protein [Candidatus Competibacteraceae bacterium]|nr:methyltransferase domain-containing protein [Candidatus Competibacteraceae bacterium]